MDEKLISFIESRNLNNLKNSNRFGFLLIILILPLIWDNLIRMEQFFFLFLGFFYFSICLLYANKKRMKDRVKKNRFYGWTEYSFSLLTLYIMYKLYFKTFDYFLIILLVECVLQSIIWIKGVQKNILCDNYKPNKVFPGYNFYTTITLIISIISLIVFNVYYVVQEYYYVYIIIGDTLYLLHCVTLVGLTFIYQNHLIKKHNLYHLLKNK